MCQECGCGIGGEVRIGGRSASAAHSHSTHHGDGHSHQHESGGHAPHTHAHDDATAFQPGRQTVAVQRGLLEKNQRLAERNRGFFRAKKLLVLNVLSSPGSGKTTLIQKTATLLASRLRVGVIVGDLATDNDAARLREAGIPVVQVTTGTVCHLEAEMIAKAAERLDLDALDVLIIENVGNLVCPAAYDLGEDLRIVLLSTTEGEDKPLKYPPMFHSADVAVITKSDLAAPAGFDRAQALAALHRIAHHARIFELSARTGDGMPAWIDYLEQQRASPKC